MRFRLAKIGILDRDVVMHECGGLGERPLYTVWSTLVVVTYYTHTPYEYYHCTGVKL
jgi:hypothetical protein